jgi:nucleoside-diphosphate-sugar epimerase
MRIFVTGATGYIGTAVTEKLIAAGHAVAGLARSDAAAQKLRNLGAEPVRGDLRDTALLQAAARASGGAIHLAMEPSADAPRLDRGVVDAVLAGLAASGAPAKPFVYTSGIWVMGHTGGHTADESTPVNPAALVAWRPAHESLVLRATGVRGIVIRPAMVYGRRGGVAGAFADAAKKGVVQFVGTGENRWPFVNVDDLADLYVLALGAAPGSLYFAADGPSIPVRQVALQAAHGARLEAIPLEEARRTMGPLADALTLDQLVSAHKAKQELGWAPKAKPVLEELAVS